MHSLSPLVAALLVLTILAVAGYFAWQQFGTLRRVPRTDGLAPEDRQYYLRQAWRRLVGCAVLVAIGAMIAWYFVGGIDHAVDALGEVRAAQPRDAAVEMTDEQKQFMKFFGYYWITILLLLLGLMLIVAWDVWAIRRFGMRHYRRIQDDRRAMIQRQLVQLRRERGLRRNGSSDD